MSAAGAVIILDVVIRDEHTTYEGKVSVDCGHHKPTPDLVERLLKAALEKLHAPKLTEDGGD